MQVQDLIRRLQALGIPEAEVVRIDTPRGGAPGMEDLRLWPVEIRLANANKSNGNLYVTFVPANATDRVVIVE